MQNQHQDDWLAGVRATYMAGALDEPPDRVRDRAKRLFGERLAEGSQSANIPPVVISATLVLDSRRGRAAAGVRSLAALDGPWQLLYRGSDVDVDLWVRPNQDGHTLNVRGQALSLAGAFISAGVVEAQPSASRPWLLGSAPPTVRSQLEPSGEFALANLERGRYDVSLRFGVHRVELSGVEF